MRNEVLLLFDAPEKRYQDIVKIVKQGRAAKVQAEWNLEEVVVDACISEELDKKGKDWNFDQHKKIDTKPTFDDFRKTVADYLSWEVEQLLKSEDYSGK
ncbi:hypothetical protein RyT2_21290 [Pseudolactococcus yaeyamensis]